MKRMIMVTLILLCFTSSSVDAYTPPRQSVEVVFVNSEGLVDFDDLHIDLLMMSLDIDEPELRNEYSEVNNGYSFKNGDYYSITAYDFDIGFEFYMERFENTLLVDGDFFYETTYYVVLYDEEGTVYYNELHNSQDVGYSNGYKTYSWYQFDFETKVMTIESERRATMLELIGLVLGGVVLGGIFVVSLFTVSQNMILKYYIGDERKQYKAYIFGFTLLYLFLAFLLGFGFQFNSLGLVLYGFLYIAIVFYFKQVTNALHGDILTLKRIMIIELPPVIFLLIGWVILELLWKGLIG